MSGQRWSSSSHPHDETVLIQERELAICPSKVASSLLIAGNSQWSVLVLGLREPASGFWNARSGCGHHGLKQIHKLCGADGGDRASSWSSMASDAASSQAKHSGLPPDSLRHQGSAVWKPTELKNDLSLLLINIVSALHYTHHCYSYIGDLRIYTALRKCSLPMNFSVFYCVKTRKWNGFNWYAVMNLHKIKPNWRWEGQYRFQYYLQTSNVLPKVFTPSNATRCHQRHAVKWI